MVVRALGSALVVFALAGTSFAGAAGKTFAVGLDDGTSAVVSFDNAGAFTAERGGVKGGGTFTETAPNGFISSVSARGIEEDPKGYFGGFRAVVIDPTVFPRIVQRILARAGLKSATIVGAGIGSDLDPYSFSGTAK